MTQGREKNMRVLIAGDYESMSRKAAAILAGQVAARPDSVLGLATGSTPLGTYRELARLHREGVVDFAAVTTFNLDEYAGLDAADEQSYHYYMNENLFNHINVRLENVHILNGRAADLVQECRDYEAAITRAGGIDLQILGIGRNGHIGFNEPGPVFEPETHLVDLDEKTINDNARFFASPEEVPRQAVTMGIKTIMCARKIILLANGSEKQQALRDMVRGKITPAVPASILQLHPGATVIVDREAARLLSEEPSL